jgi:hypothetical protein
MSNFFSGIVAAEHTFVAFFTKEMVKLGKDEPKISAVVSAGVKYATGCLDIALPLVGYGAVVPAANAISAQIQQDLVTVNSLVYDFGPTPTAATMFASIKANLSSLLTDAHVTNPTSAAAVNKAINEVGALGAAIAAVPAANPTPAPASGNVVG